MLYVDSLKLPFGRMLMSHLIADTPEELQAAETALGLPKGSIQYPGTWKEHLDVSQSKRAQAISSGATVIPATQLTRMLTKRREAQAAGPAPQPDAPR